MNARSAAGLLGCLVLMAGAACTPQFSLRVNEQEDVFVQETRNQVDILLVVDNSCSMIEEQEKLSTNFENFIGAFLEAEVDYQIGVITTDMASEEQQGRLQGEIAIIDPSTADAAAVFAENVLVGTNGSGFERGLEAARAALSEPILSEVNAGFLREGASLSIAFFSDEEDFSPDPVDLYIDYFKSLKGPMAYRDDTLVNLSAVVGDVPGGCPLGAEELTADPAYRYVEVAVRTGGVVDSICNDDFSPMVRELGLTISGLRRVFLMTRVPRVETIMVLVDDVEQLSGWSYDAERNAVIFSEEATPVDGVTIRVNYEVAPREGALE